MYYKIKMLDDGHLKVVDYVDEKANDGFIYATKKEVSKIKKELFVDSVSLTDM